VATTNEFLEAYRPARHIIVHFIDGFYSQGDATNSVKAPNEVSWSSRADFNATLTIPPRYSEQTHGNRGDDETFSHVRACTQI